MLKPKLLAQNSKIVKKPRVLVIGIGPRENLIGALPEDKSKVSIDPIPKVDPVRVVFSCGKDETLLREEPRINVDLASAFPGETLLDFIRKMLDLRQTLRPDEVQKTGYLPYDALSHLLFIVIGISKWFRRRDEIKTAVTLAKSIHGTLLYSEVTKEQTRDKLGWKWLFGLTHAYLRP
jgi:hypothetical protein